MLGFLRRCASRVILSYLSFKTSLIYEIWGIDQLSNFINRLPKQFLKQILTKFRAQIGNNVNFSSNVVIDNAMTRDFSNLKIGNGCYIGKNVFFDLVKPIIIENEAVISAKVTFLTHSDPGERPLRKYYKRKTGSIRVGRGAWIGAAAIILPGVTIGECAVVGAGALVNKDIPAYSVAIGVPVRIIKKIDQTIQ